MVHGFDLLLDEALELVAMLGPDAIEAGRAYYLLLEPLEQVQSFLATDQHVDHLHVGQRVQDFLQQHLAEEASGASYEQPLPCVELLHFCGLIRQHSEDTTLLLHHSILQNICFELFVLSYFKSINNHY